MHAKTFFQFSTFIVSIAGLFSPPPVLLSSGVYTVCLENVIIRGDSLTGCNIVNTTVCDYQQDEIFLYAMECMTLRVPSTANITKNTEELRIFFSDPRNWSISMIILALNIIAMVGYSVYKYCQRRKRSDDEELNGLTTQRWVRDSNGDYRIEPSDGMTANVIRVGNPLTSPQDDEHSVNI
jgi:hypothetical protein